MVLVVGILDKLLPIVFLGLAVVNIFLGVLLAYIGFVESMQDIAIVGVSLMFTGTLYLCIAHGLRTGAKWAWIVGVVVVAFNIVSSIVLASVVGIVMYAIVLVLMVLVAPRYGIGVGVFEEHVVSESGRFVHARRRFVRKKR